MKTPDPLVPDRYPQLDFFTADIFDATPKSDVASMEYPLFSLAKKADKKVKSYESRDGSKWIKIRPSSKGCATVYDRHILIFCISQLMAGLKAGRKAERVIRFHAVDLLRATNKKTNGEAYQGLQRGLYRLTHTEIETNITTGDTEIYSSFGFIESFQIKKQSRDGRMEMIEVTLSDWLFRAIDKKGKELLTIAPEYFRLRKPLEMRLYEIARKQCGTRNDEWGWKLETLKEMTGSQSTLSEFERMISGIIENNEETKHIPDYDFEYDAEKRKITCRPKPEFSELFQKPKAVSEIEKQIDAIRLKTETYDNARKFAAGWDMYNEIEDAWRTMLKKRQSVPDKPDGSFVNYVKAFVKLNGEAR
ncbi:MAG: replication initiator protein A [Pseudomonadota bacterium]